MDFQTEPVFIKQHSFPNSECILLMDRYPKLEIYYSLTKDAHIIVRAFFFHKNEIGVILTSDKITQLIGAKNFTNTFMLFQQVKDPRTKLLLIIGLLTKERLNDGSKTDAVCQTDITYMFMSETCEKRGIISEKQKNQDQSQHGTSSKFDLNFDLEEAHMEILDIQDPKAKSESIKKKFITPSVWNEVIPQVEDPQFGIHAEYIFEQIRVAAKLKRDKQLRLLCESLKGKCSSEIKTRELTGVLHDFLSNAPVQAASEQKAADCVLILINYGADVLKKIDGITALHIIALRSMWKSSAAVAEVAMSYVMKLGRYLRYKDGRKDIDDFLGHSFDDQGLNPVMVAAISCNHEVLEVFLKYFPKIVDVKSQPQEGQACSALTLVTLKAMEAQKKRYNLEGLKKVVKILKEYKADPNPSFHKLDYAHFSEFFNREFPHQLSITDEKEQKIATDSKDVSVKDVIEKNSKNDIATDILDHQLVTGQKNIAKNDITTDISDDQLVTGQKNIANEISIGQVTDAAKSLHKEEDMNMQNKIFIKRKESTVAPIVVRKIMDIRDPKLMTKVILKNSKLVKKISEVTKPTNNVPIKKTPVLVRVNKKDIGTNFKVVSMGDLGKSPQFKILNKDFLAINSAKTKPECSPKIIKVESNADYIHSAAINTNLTASTINIKEDTKVQTKDHENVNFFTPIIVKTEPIDETNVNVKAKQSMKSISIKHLNEDSCATSKIGKRKSLESNVPAIKEKKSRKLDLTESLVAPEGQIGTTNNNEIDKPIAIGSESKSDIFKDDDNIMLEAYNEVGLKPVRTKNRKTNRRKKKGNKQVILKWRE